MASFTLPNTPFPTGTSVSAYDAQGYSTFPAGGPPGSAVATATVTAGSLTFTGLTNHRPYFAAAKVGEVWKNIRFSVGDNGPPPSVEDIDYAEVGPGKTLVVNEDESGFEFLDIGTQTELDDATADIAVIKEAPINIEYPEYGAVGHSEDTAVDCTGAIEKAIEALPENGGEIFFPRRYRFSTPLNLDETRSVKLRGVTGTGGGLTPASELIYVPAGTDAAISARSSAGFQMEDLRLRYLSGEFTGALVDLSHGESGDDSSGFAFNRAHLVGASVYSALGVNLDKAISGGFRDTIFENLDIGVKGKKEEGIGQYSNVINFVGGQFKEIATIPVRNAGEAWHFLGVTFEQLHNGKAGAYDSEAGVKAAGLDFESCWFGDASIAEGTWITFRGTALGVEGGSLGSGGTGISVPDTTSDVIEIKRVRFTTLVNAIVANFGAATQRYDINPNGFVGISGKKVSLDNGTTEYGEGRLCNTLATAGELEVNGDLNHDGTKVGFYGKAPATKPNVKPAGEVNAKELCEALESLGLIE